MSIRHPLLTIPLAVGLTTSPQATPPLPSLPTTTPADTATVPVLAAVTSLRTTAVPVWAAACRGSAPDDFNGDGARDLAVGAPYATVNGRFRAGAVAVRSRGSVTWLSQAAPGVNDPPEVRDGFGAALAAGDFNGDRCGDLAVGIPDEAFGRRAAGADGNGAVQIFLGSPSGLRAGPLLTVRLLDRSYGSDRFGAALTAANLDGDREDELVIGAPGLAGGGGVVTMGVRKRGLTGAQLISQGTGWVGQRKAQADGFGAVLAAGDFDGDHRAEIAVGAPGDGARSEGSVTMVDPWSRTADYISQDEPGVSGARELYDKFGGALAAGDFDGDGRDDLAVGVPGEDMNAMPPSIGNGEGGVQVLYGPSLRQRGEMWSRKSPGIAGAATRYDHFGAALAAGDLTGDGVTDLAIGAPGTGAVHILRGTKRKGITTTASTLRTSPVGRTAQFGWALSAQGKTLLIGAPGANTFGGTVLQLSGTTITTLPLPPSGLTGYAFP